MKKILFIIFFFIGGVSFIEVSFAQTNECEGIGQGTCSIGLFCLQIRQGIAPGNPIGSSRCVTLDEYLNAKFPPNSNKENSKNNYQNTIIKCSYGQKPSNDGKRCVPDCMETLVPSPSWIEILNSLPLNPPKPQRIYPPAELVKFAGEQKQELQSSVIKAFWNFVTHRRM